MFYLFLGFLGFRRDLVLDRVGAVLLLLLLLLLQHRLLLLLLLLLTRPSSPSPSGEGEIRDEVNRDREDDGGILLGGDGTKGLHTREDERGEKAQNFISQKIEGGEVVGKQSECFSPFFGVAGRPSGPPGSLDPPLPRP